MNSTLAIFSKFSITSNLPISPVCIIKLQLLKLYTTSSLSKPCVSDINPIIINSPTIYNFVYIIVSR